MTTPAAPAPIQAAVNTLKAYETQLTFPKLTPNDRCDACVQAAVAQVKPDPTVDNLKLCGHHFRMNKTKIEEAGWPFEVAPDEAELHTFGSWAKPRDNSARDAGSV